MTPRAAALLLSSTLAGCGGAAVFVGDDLAAGLNQHGFIRRERTLPLAATYDAGA